MNTRPVKTLPLVALALILLGCNEAGNNAPPTTTNTTVANTGASGIPDITLVNAFAGLRFEMPVFMQQAPANDSVWVVAEQRGRLRSFRSGDSTASVMLDISDRVSFGGELGLLGFAFHPEYANNGYVFVSYTGRLNGKLTSFVSRFSSLPNQTILDQSSEVIVISVTQPYSNHNGGQIAFGPDGNLYIGWGDGGSGGDPDNNAQNTNNLLGKLLRIRADTLPYQIPADNPFTNSGGKPEIYAYGLRNPWRWSFDKQNGDLWLGDVGQNQWEEIDIVVKGANYGWHVMEGTHCYLSQACDNTNYVLPVFEYSHADGIAVTGGYVYRGTRFPALNGVYFLGDYGSGKIWGLRNGQEGLQSRLLVDSPSNIASFAEDRSGELYIIDYNGGIYQIQAAN